MLYVQSSSLFPFFFSKIFKVFPHSPPPGYDALITPRDDIFYWIILEICHGLWLLVRNLGTPIAGLSTQWVGAGFQDCDTARELHTPNPRGIHWFTIFDWWIYNGSNRNRRKRSLFFIKKIYILNTFAVPQLKFGEAVCVVLHLHLPNPTGGETKLAGREVRVN